MREKDDLRNEWIAAKIQDLTMFLLSTVRIDPHRDCFGFHRRGKLGAIPVARVAHRRVSFMGRLAAVAMLEIAAVDALAAMEVAAAFHLVLAHGPSVRIRVSLPEGNQEEKDAEEDFSTKKHHRFSGLIEREGRCQGLRYSFLTTSMTTSSPASINWMV